jgi:phosphatidylethanolamine/phosphatidyl-N-methylethanolamine N-methyltransferase
MKTKITENVYFNFWNEYLRNFREIGTIGPDSAGCVNGLLKAVPFESAELILEYGAASGSVTREILKRKNPDSTFICFEKNHTFYNLLDKTVRGRNVSVVNDDVFNAANILSSRFEIMDGSVDCIISTLPCSSLKFDELLRKSVLPLLKEDGVFVQYMHTVSALKGFRLKPVLQKYFRKIDSGFVFLNIPPALIYTCSGHDRQRS